MQPHHWLALVLTPAAQSLLLFSAAAKPAEVATTRLFAILAVVVPIACYLWALHDAPLAPKDASRPVRCAFRGLAASGLSLGGFIFGLELITSHAALH